MWSKTKKTLFGIIATALASLTLLFGAGCTDDAPSSSTSVQTPSPTLVLNQPVLELDVDETFTLEVLNLPQGLLVEWESMQPSVAAVTQSGEVTGKYIGETTVKAYVDGQTLVCYVTVGVTLNPVPVFTLSGMEKTNGGYERNLIKGATYDFIPTLTVDGETVEANVTATSSEPTNVAVDGCKITALAPTQTAKITFTCEYNGKTYTLECSITVEEVAE